MTSAASGETWSGMCRSTLHIRLYVAAVSKAVDTIVHPIVPVCPARSCASAVITRQVRGSPQMVACPSRTRSIALPAPTSLQQQYAAVPRSSLAEGSRASRKASFACCSARAAVRNVETVGAWETYHAPSEIGDLELSLQSCGVS